jgi:hypothetical protein
VGRFTSADTVADGPDPFAYVGGKPGGPTGDPGGTAPGGKPHIQETWKSDATLSDGQTNKAFRESGTHCFYCGRQLNPSRPGRSLFPVTGHVYPRLRALQRAASQEVYNAYVTNTRNLRVICNSCNGIQGGLRSPSEMGLGRWATPERQGEAQAIFDFIGQLYGFEP